MPEADISWQVLRQIVQRWAGTAAELVEVKPLFGGCINTTLSLTTSTGDRAVVKISPHRVNRHYQTEAHQLELLRSVGVPTPQVYALNLASLDNPDSYLLMEFIEGINLAEARQVCSEEEFDSLQQQLADLVLAMHERSADLYGRVVDGEAMCYTSWPQFYRDVYDHIWQEAWKDPHLPNKTRKQIAKVHGKLDKLLMHDDRPRLVHWDLWANNMLCRKGDDGQWKIVSILDPECKWAHCEAEIAYLELFKTVTPAFMKRYQDAHKLSADYHRVRKPIYQMYELINHLRLFGPDYVPRLQQAVDQTVLVA